MKLLGLTGLAGSGKDTLADGLLHDYEGRKIAFAGPLKEACQTLFVLTDAQLHDRDAKEAVDTRWGRSPREIFQFVGTDLLRNLFDTEIFIKTARIRIESLRDTDLLVIVTDCRFENETRLIRELGGTVIHLRRSQRPAVRDHESERGLDVNPDSDRTLWNDGTVEELLLGVRSIVSLDK